jgi:hypothetical protein
MNHRQANIFVILGRIEPRCLQPCKSQRTYRKQNSSDRISRKKLASTYSRSLPPDSKVVPVSSYRSGSPCSTLTNIWGHRLPRLTGNKLANPATSVCLLLLQKATTDPIKDKTQGAGERGTSQPVDERLRVLPSLEQMFILYFVSFKNSGDKQCRECVKNLLHMHNPHPQTNRK